MCILKFFKYLKVPTSLCHCKHTPWLAAKSSVGYRFYQVSLLCHFWTFCPFGYFLEMIADLLMFRWSHWYSDILWIQPSTSAIGVMYWLQLQLCHIHHWGCDFLKNWLLLQLPFLVLRQLPGTCKCHTVSVSYVVFHARNSVVHIFNNSLDKWVNGWVQNSACSMSSLGLVSRRREVNGRLWGVLKDKEGNLDLKS